MKLNVGCELSALQGIHSSSSDGVYEVARLPPFPSIPSAHGSRALLLLFWQLAVASPFWMPAWYVALPPLRHQIGNQRLSRTTPSRRLGAFPPWSRGQGGTAGRSAALPSRRRGEFVHCTLQNLQFLGRKYMSELSGREQFRLRYSRPSVLKWQWWSFHKR